MAKVSIVFGIVLILLGIGGYIGTGSSHPTALIPAAVGLLLGVFGFLALTPDPKRRMLFMHINVTIGLLGFLGTAKAIYDYIQLLQGKSFAYPAAVEAKAAMAVITLIYVILCVRSFIAARRARA